MKISVQKKYDMIGTYGCYFLCLLHIANKENDAGKYYDKYLKKGYIDEECTILNPCAILEDLLRKTYKVEKVKFATDEQYADKKNYIIVEYWFNPNTGLHHFVLPNWDPFGKSNTCACPSSYIESVRLFTLVA